MIPDSRNRGIKAPTLRKYFFLSPSGRTVFSLAVLVQAEIPLGSAEMTLVPLGKTMKAGA